MYVIHRYNSGFITYRKSRKEKQLEKLPKSTLTPNELDLVRSTKNWRESLSLSKSTRDVLVVFAWAHNDELRNAEMYPEFLAGDITFGDNKERRDDSKYGTKEGTDIKTQKKWKYSDRLCSGCQIMDESGDEILFCKKISQW